MRNAYYVPEKALAVGTHFPPLVRLMVQFHPLDSTPPHSETPVPLIRRRRGERDDLIGLFTFILILILSYVRMVEVGIGTDSLVS